LSSLAQRGKYQSNRLLERQARILEVARTILGRSGYEGLTMRALAEEAGVAKKTLYNQFAGKDDLVLMATNDLLQKITAKVALVTPGITRILAREQAIFEQIQTTPAYALAMIRALHAAKPEHALIDALIQQGAETIKRELQIAQKRAEVRPEIDMTPICWSLTSHSWGVLTLWAKQCFSLAQLEQQLTLAQLGILQSIAVQDTQILLAEKLNTLLTRNG
jgi:AcrR family transcriptional regulator